ncbi:MAG TPA: hypothetical protein VFB63_16480 [Bryobacteraceae bacterium]|nr:hypothetical protein [Bryobacteraceae bacterium]
MSTPAVDFLAELESARKKFHVKPLQASHEGLSVAQLPEGVYGYSVSAPTLEAPLFIERIFQSFEYHKLAGGAIQILGFATAAEVATLNAEKEPVDFKLYPEPFGESNVLCVMDLSRVVRSKAPSRTDGNYMTLQTNPRGA